MLPRWAGEALQQHRSPSCRWCSGRSQPKFGLYLVVSELHLGSPIPLWWRACSGTFCFISSRSAPMKWMEIGLGFKSNEVWPSDWCRWHTCRSSGLASIKTLSPLKKLQVVSRHGLLCQCWWSSPKVTSNPRISPPSEEVEPQGRWPSPEATPGEWPAGRCQICILWGETRR